MQAETHPCYIRLSANSLRSDTHHILFLVPHSHWILLWWMYINCTAVCFVWFHVAACVCVCRRLNRNNLQVLPELLFLGTTKLFRLWVLYLLDPLFPLPVFFSSPPFLSLSLLFAVSLFVPHCCLFFNGTFASFLIILINVAFTNECNYFSYIILLFH